jgi:glutamyl-Q tRNA(Asp) synthetase
LRPSRSRRRNAANVGSASTAIATTGTADRERPYVGRFAPSPTGALHLGSLVAAVGSFLDARHHGGKWLLRIEDLDTPRVIPGCADQMLRTLEAFGLHWDGEVEYQSRRLDTYQAALDALRSQGQTFQCLCSRRQRQESDSETGYAGTCRGRGIASDQGATRFRVDDASRIVFDDLIQGRCEYALRNLGDVVIRRRDGVFAYQLAVVVDDAHQQITDVVRGADLIESTAWQIALQRVLKLHTPRYAHLPLVVETGGMKLAKSRRSVPADAARATEQLTIVLRLLRQNVTGSLDFESAPELLKWAASRWNRNEFQGLKTLDAPILGRN